MDKRPKYMNLPYLAKHMSITAKVSILHRISGILLFLAIPLLLFMLHRSLTEVDFYQNCYAVLTTWGAKLIFLFLFWAFIYHMCAGIRFLLLDINLGSDRLKAQNSAKLVMISAILITIIMGVIIW